jgi:hypothetical protein
MRAAREGWYVLYTAGMSFCVLNNWVESADAEPLIARSCFWGRAVVDSRLSRLGAVAKTQMHACGQFFSLRKHHTEKSHRAEIAFLSGLR